MLTTHGETSEADVLKRISIARGNAEPDPEPTAEPEAVDVSEEEAPAEELESEEESILEPESDEAEEPEELENEADSIDDDEEDLYVELEGREINLKDIKEWEQGHLRQSDYTRKTTELAEQRRAFEAEREQFQQQAKGLDGKIATLEAIISDDTLTDAEVTEMREYEPEEYIRYKEKLERRKQVLADAKSVNTGTVDISGEREKLWKDNPSWMDNGKPTDAYTDDMKLVSEYAKSKGYSDEELQGVQSARHWQTIIDAAKYQEVSKKNAAIKKKVRKAPVSTKPRAATQTSLVQKVKEAEATLKRTGKPEDAVKLRRLKRQLQN